MRLFRSVILFLSEQEYLPQKQILLYVFRCLVGFCVNVALRFLLQVDTTYAPLINLHERGIMLYRLIMTFPSQEGFTVTGSLPNTLTVKDAEVFV